LADKLPIDDERYWRDRLTKCGPRDIHRSVYDVPHRRWDNIQRRHRQILARLVKPNDKVLDAGCGYGALLEILPEHVDYHGVDQCQCFVSKAQELHPDRHFFRGNLSDLSNFEDHHFDLVVCRSLEGMVRDNRGEYAWFGIEREMLRVGQYVVLLNYSRPTVYRVLDTLQRQRSYHFNTLRMDDNYLTYLYHEGQVCEIYDVWVNEAKRRQGIATGLIEELKQLVWGTLIAYTRMSNTAAKHFYDKLGFSGTVIPRFYADEPAVLYTLSVRRSEHGAEDQ